MTLQSEEEEEASSLGTLRDLLEHQRLDITEYGVLLPGEDEAGFLLRMLTARKSDVKAAFDLIQEDHKWRREFGVPELRKLSAREVLGCDPLAFNESYPHFVQGFCKEGRPIIFDIACKCYVNKLLEMTDMEKILRFHVWRCEKNADLLVSQSQRLGRPVEKFLVVIDIKGMSMRQVTSSFLSLVKTISAVDQNHYPERLGTLFIVNIPSVFYFIWGGIKPWLDRRTLDKIRICKDDFMPHLLELVEKDQLPPEYGGTGAPLAYDVDPTDAYQRLLDEAAAEIQAARDGCGAVGVHVNMTTVDERSGIGTPIGTRRSHRRSHSDDASEYTQISVASEESETEVSYAHALHGQEASHGLSPDELQAIEDAFRLAADMSDTVPENDDTEGDVEDEDEEDAEDQETLKTKRRVDIINLLLIATSVVIITMGSYARASYWWTGSLVSWGLWTSLCLLIIGCFLFFTALIGLTGAQLKSPTVLFIYTVPTGVLAFLLISFGIACLILLDAVEHLVVDNWVAISAAMPTGTTSGGVVAGMREKQLMLGISCTAGGVIAAAACYLGHALRQRLLDHEIQSKKWVRLRVIMRCANVASGMFALSMLVYGIYALRIIFYTKYLPFPHYMLVVLGMALFQFSILGFVISFGSSLRSATLLFWYRVLLFMSCVCLVVFSALSFSKVDDAKSHVHRHWDTIEPNLQDIGRNITKSDVVAITQSNLIIVGVLEIMQVLLLSINIWTSIKLHEMLKARSDEDSESGSSSAPEYEKFAKLTNFDLYLFTYCFLAVLVHFFWEGEYVVFHKWLAQDASNGDNQWFLAGWREYQKVDGRYAEGQGFILAKETVAAVISGPACIFLAWSTYERQPSRDIAAVFVAIPELYSVTLTFAAGLLDNEHHASEDSYLYFWFFFVFVAVLRFLAPLPILIAACSHVFKCVAYHDQKAMAIDVPSTGASETNPITAPTVYASPQRNVVDTPDVVVQGIVVNQTSRKLNGDQ